MAENTEMRNTCKLKLILKTCESHKRGRGVGEVKHTATRRLWQPTHTYTLTDNGEGGKEEETKETH